MLQYEQHECKSLLLECSIRVFTIRTRIGLFDSVNAFQKILNVLLECIEPFNAVQCIYMHRLFY